MSNGNPSNSSTGGMPPRPPAEYERFKQDSKTPIPLSADYIVKQVTMNPLAECFQDQFEKPLLWLPVDVTNPHFECLPLGSKECLAWLDQKCRSIPVQKSEDRLATLKKASKLLELEAMRGFSRNLHPRFYERRHRNSICIDLGDDDCRMIEVDERGWRISPQQEPLFSRSSHQKALPTPAQKGDPLELFKFVPMRNDQEKLLLLTWVLAAMHPGILSPILAIVGIKGSAKTTVTRRLRTLIDPSVTPLLGNTSTQHLEQLFLHHAVPCFENVSHFNRATADVFCRAVTGTGMERRKLFTDSESVLIFYQRPILINGLAIPSTRTDFLDRCLLLRRDRLNTFRPLQELDKQFEEAAPRILGGLLDLLSKTIRALESTPSSGKFRLADFARFGRAVAVGMGRTAKSFDEAYQANIEVLNREIVEEQPVARLLRIFVDKYPAVKPWTGSLEALDKELRKIASQEKISLSEKAYPKSPRWLSPLLCDLKGPLREADVEVKQLPRQNKIRPWQICQAPKQTTTNLSQIQKRLEKKTDE